MYLSLPGLKICFAEPSDKMSDDFEFGSNLEELINKPSTPSCCFQCFVFCTYVYCTCAVHLGEPYSTFTYVTGNQPCRTKLYFGRTLIHLGRTNYILNFTNVGQNVRDGFLSFMCLFILLSRGLVEPLLSREAPKLYRLVN